MTPELKDRIRTLKANKAFLIEYIKMKLLEEDFHGVADAAMDIRDIEAELKGLRFKDFNKT